MVKIRNLQLKDADCMKEWMRSKDIGKYFLADFPSFTDKDIEQFIRNGVSENNIHFAIVNNIDEYMGTISLKNIDRKNKNAEYAIVIREKYRGKNVAREATRLILDYAFNVLKLSKVYLNVLEDNIRAIKFYEKEGFQLEGEFRNHVVHNGIPKKLYWYAIFSPKAFKEENK